MIHTETILLEKYFIKVYKSSCECNFDLTERITATELIKEFKLMIKGVDIFEDSYHEIITNKLYFDLEKSKQIKMENIAAGLYITPKTLQRYRKKYSKMMKKLIDYYEIEF